MYERVAERVDRMFERGLVDEVRSLGPRLGPTARQALGYKQILDAPDATQEEWRAEIIRATKRFARRQDSWFRSDPRITWLDASAPDVVAELVGSVR